MLFKLKGFIKFNKNAEDIKEEIGKVIDYANKKLSTENEAPIKKWKIEKDKLILQITSQTLRPHECLIRLRKFLAEQLGKEHRLAAKEIFAEEYSVEFETENAAKKPVKVPFVAGIKVNGKKCVLLFKELNEELLEKNYIDKLIKLVNEKIKYQYYEGRDEYKEYVWESKEKKIHTSKDPAEEMEKLGWIRRTVGKGQWILGREVTALINVFKELSIKHIYAPLGFYEMTFPKIEQWKIPARSGHAGSVYPNAYFVSVPKNSSPEFWEEVIDHYKITGEIDVETIVKKSENIGILSYAQCPPFWPFLEGKTIDEATLPLRVYDWSGPTYRNEAGGTHGLDRLEEFHRVETLWVGTKAQTIEMWKKLREAFTKFFDEVLDMEVKVARVSPWWMAHAGLKTEKGSEDVGTYDFDAYLPYRGTRSAEWLEIQNASSNGDKYPKAFTVKGRKEEIWSGCAGGSLERWVAAFIAQKGFDTKKWPKEVRELFEQKTKGIKPLRFF